MVRKGRGRGGGDVVYWYSRYGRLGLAWFGNASDSLRCDPITPPSAQTLRWGVGSWTAAMIDMSSFGWYAEVRSHGGFAEK
jgi:hypothetical protein